MIGPTFIHQSKSKASYSDLANCIEQLANVKIFGTDGDKNLYEPFEKKHII